MASLPAPAEAAPAPTLPRERPLSRQIFGLSSKSEDRRCPNLLLAAIDSAMDNFDRSRPLKLGTAFNSLKCTPRVPNPVTRSTKSCPRD
ncbi:hypothetical protein TNCT_319001 [Trichonephila clavata]|uniref:Uncharacterized protein n=1 Tax=Trichonephila clavata TaxID=2740835 RepID=A0A8X6J424_TRICU|nr:hypothetical protein TNCT_319001 [Trichonephila clavata]